MITVVIPQTSEPNVEKLTEENMKREGYPPGSRVVVAKSWLKGLEKCETDFICFVEPDALVNSGYFTSMIGLFQQKAKFKRLAMMASSTSVIYWPRKFYGYSYEDGKLDIVKKAHSNEPYPVRVGFFPGAIIRTASLRRILEDIDVSIEPFDLQQLSLSICMAFWKTNYWVYINPNSTYVTSEEYVEVPTTLYENVSKVEDIFKKESI